MLIPTARLVLSGVLLSLLSTPVFATEFYVDVVSGNDANAGTSPATAWKTITFASASAAQGNTHTIHIAPGTYSAATGESFPLQFRGQHVIGDSGPSSTIVDAGGAPVVVRVANGPGWPVTFSVATLRGLTLQGAATCIELIWAWASITTSFSDLILRNATTVGINLMSSGSTAGAGEYHVQLSRVYVDACQRGLSLSGFSGSNSVDAIDCAFVNSNDHGVYLHVMRPVSASFVRCSFTGNASAGVGASASAGSVGVHGFGHLTMAYSDCLFANNQGGWAAQTWLSGTIDATLTRCTVANNAFGLVTTASGMFPPTYALDSTLVWGNGTDFSAPNTPTTSFSQISGPDPLFRDPANGDYRVYFGSPVIDAGNPSTLVGTLDIARVPRSIDGDLDTLERADIGCHEFRTLDIDTTGQQGTVLGLEIFGASGSSSSMRLGRGAFGAPVATAFGEFDMSTIANFPWVTFPVAPGPGFLFQRTLPTAPIFIGQTYSFQGLVTSAASPSGAAWSNAVSFTIVP